MLRNRQGGGTGELIFNRSDNVMRPKRLAVVFADMAVRGKAGFRPQVTGELARIVVLDDYHAAALGEDATDVLGVEWDDPLNLKVIRDNAFIRCELLQRLPNNTLSRAP